MNRILGHGGPIEHFLADRQEPPDRPYLFGIEVHIDPGELPALSGGS
jgi:hypothetical protein